MHLETYTSLCGLSEMGLSTVTNAVHRIVSARDLYAKSVDAGTLWVVNTGRQVLPLAPPDPAHCPLESTLVGMHLSITDQSHAYLEPQSQPDERGDLAAFWWSAHAFYGTLETHHVAKHGMHQLLPGKRFMKQVGDLMLDSVLN